MPFESSALAGFDRIKRETSCPFAWTSLLWGFDDWDPLLSVADNVRDQAPLMERFCAEADALDGIVLQLPGSFGRTVDALADTIGEVLKEFCTADPAGGQALEGQIDRPGWWLTFSGVELFLLTFAPCYPPSHPRWSYGQDSLFVVFQPRVAFFRRRRGQPSMSSAVRNGIRKSFLERGQPYDLALADSNIEAHQFVKPLELGHPPVRWWSAPRFDPAVDPHARRESGD